MMHTSRGIAGVILCSGMEGRPMGCFILWGGL